MSKLYYPTPTNPLVLVYRGDIPAMKNDRTVFTDKNDKFRGLGRSKVVRRWLQTAGDHVSEQFERQGFDTLGEPCLVGAFVSVGVYMAEKNIRLLPKKDLDNAYTTIQETWQGIVIDDDRQIADFHPSRIPIFNKALLHSMSFLWLLDTGKVRDDRHYMADQFMEFYNDYYRRKTISEIIEHSQTAKRKSGV
jgi:hypothetical protein